MLKVSHEQNTQKGGTSGAKDGGGGQREKAFPKKEASNGIWFFWMFEKSDVAVFEFHYILPKLIFET